MKLKHYDNDGRARFVTFCTHRRLPILTNDPFRRIVVNAIDTGRATHGFALLAYVIMPEHVHLVLWPPEVMALGRVVGEIKRCAAIEILSHSVERRVLWQRRCYDHNCRSETSVWDKVEYCHQNPVKRGLVRRAESWEWSSCRWYAGDRDVPLQMDLAARQIETHPLGLVEKVSMNVIASLPEAGVAISTVCPARCLRLPRSPAATSH